MLHEKTPREKYISPAQSTRSLSLKMLDDGKQERNNAPSIFSSRKSGAGKGQLVRADSIKSMIERLRDEVDRERRKRAKQLNNRTNGSATRTVCTGDRYPQISRATSTECCFPKNDRSQEHSIKGSCYFSLSELHYSCHSERTVINHIIYGQRESYSSIVCA